ncbi:MAG TPA: SulP family inorganic anion transporter [Noviherbaspirillum sp.]|jgi:SulP family sulfate permease|uniref:SulP family inorganic anion transporter n=1 Tax=Noviherbaspirillum sp. TaxID=1926288 RepID=UPI002DDCD6B2|nr:SulP family inorganic anion transporter [Noviherbaspirillum sp.]HEV2611761.1 SulP family inorganic anion transporter [Noviherbaspirillum sp.]
MNHGTLLVRLLPFLKWPRPTAASLRRDAWAGLSVGLVLIPQAVAYATLAGMPPQTGLYAALLPALIGILWGSSALLAVGPVALTSLLSFGALSPLAAPGSDTWVALAIWLAIYAGIFQLLLGAFRLGRIANLVSQPVMAGFINAAAIIIILSQVPALLGAPDLLFWQFPLSQMAWPTTFGCVALLLLLGFKRYLPRAPGILLVSLIGIAASIALDYVGRGGAVIGAIPSGLPSLLLPPQISLTSHQELWPAALVLALISFTEAMSSCRMLARKTNARWDENQELIGQGLAKITSGFSGAFPVSGSISRSALNLYAGAQTAWANLFAASCVLFSLLFLTDYLFYLPRSVVAAMIIVPVFGLIDVGAIRRVFAVSRIDGGIAVATFVATLFSMPRLHWGVFVGVGLTMAVYLYRLTEPRVIEVSLHPDGTLRDRNRFNLPALAPDLLAVRLDAALNFLTAAALERFINEHCRTHPDVRRVLICSSAINGIDASGVDMLESLRTSLQGAGIDLYFSGIKKQVWDVMEGAGMIAALRRDRLFPTDRQAVLALASNKPAAD